MYGLIRWLRQRCRRPFCRHGHIVSRSDYKQGRAHCSLCGVRTPEHDDMGREPCATS